MLAEGSFDPSTGLHSSTLSSGGDHNLQFMGASCPMGTKDRMTYLKDITLVGEVTGGKPSHSNFTNRNCLTLDH